MSASNRSRFIPTREDGWQILRGLLMGAADIVPGVSGGTVALILGIYSRLVQAISRCDRECVQLVMQRRWQAAADRCDLRFLVTLGLGIGLGVLTLGSLMHWLLEHQRQYTYAVFCGLIAGSCWLVGRTVGRWRGAETASLIAGALFALWVVRLPALQQPPADLWYLFVCGVIAICAMILPGISGAFLLVILGKYHELTGIIKQIPKLAVTGHDLLQVAVFAAGCVVGLLSFSRLLKWLLSQQYAITMATLTGFMLGSLYKIWPFQQDLTPELPFKEKLFELLPWEAIPVNLTTGITLLLMLGGLLGVILLESVARRFVPVAPAAQPSS